VCALVTAACGRSVRHKASEDSESGAGTSAVAFGGGTTGVANGGTSGTNDTDPPTGTGGGGTIITAPSPGFESVDFLLTLENCDWLETQCTHGVGCGRERHAFVFPYEGDLELVYESQWEMSANKLWPDRDHLSGNHAANLEIVDDRTLPHVSLSAEPFQVWLDDVNADGVADGLRLKAQGTCYNGSDTLYDTTDVPVTLSGTPAASTPKLEIRGDGWYDPLELLSNEPLTLSSTATLQTPSGAIVATPEGSSWRPDDVDSQLLYGFVIKDDLPRDTDLLWHLDATNVAGQPAPAVFGFRTEKAWMPLGDLGFEDGVDAHVVGAIGDSCAVLDETPRTASFIGATAALEGQASLFVPPGLDVAILLARPPGATTLKLRATAFLMAMEDDAAGEHAMPGFGVRTRLGAATVQALTQNLQSNPDSSFGPYPWMSPDGGVVLALPEEPGDLFLEIHTTCSTHYGSPHGNAAWVDALEFE